MNDPQADVAAIAKRHGLSEGAGRALFDALVAGGGHRAQFSHPELGGMGQWSGGMLQIGDMFNDALKAKVSAFCHDMAAVAGAAPRQGSDHASSKAASPWAISTPDPWWPASLGSPSSSGAQNGMSYACFPDKRRHALRHRRTPAQRLLPAATRPGRPLVLRPERAGVARKSPDGGQLNHLWLSCSGLPRSRCRRASAGRCARSGEEPRLAHSQDRCPSAARNWRGSHPCPCP